jgi:hypothetical protein
LREGQNIKEDQVDQRDDHENAKDAWKASLTEDLPVRKDDDKRGQEESDQKGNGMVMHHAEVIGVGGLEIGLAHGPESYAGRCGESRWTLGLKRRLGRLKSVHRAGVDGVDFWNLPLL